MKRSISIIAAIAAVAALGAGVVSAHPGSGMGPGWHMGPGAGMGWGMGPGRGMGPGMGPGYGMGPGTGPGYGMGPGYRMGPGMGPGYGMGPGFGMGPGMGPGQGMGRGMGLDATAAVAGHLAALRTQLKITPAQDGAWKAYEKVVTEQATAMQALRDKFHAEWQNAKPGATPPDMAAHRQAMVSQRESAWKAQNAAQHELFAALTPEQRAIADRSFGPLGGRRFAPR